MRKLTFCILFLMIGFVKASAQNVGIGIAVPTARLHVFAASNPLRLEGLQSGAAADSILTTDATGVIRKRTTASVFASSGWALTGNAGTSSTSNFIGTTDQVALIFRTNNLRSGLIDFDSTKRNTSFGNRAMAATITGYGNNAFGYQALNKVTSGFSNVGIGDSAAFTLTSGSENVAVGTDAGLSLTTGYQNVLAGIESGKLLTTGFQNVALGYRSMATNSAGEGNIAIGYKSLEDNFGSENIAVGLLAMSNNTGGSANIAIGSQALLNNLTGFNNYGIGSNALGLVSTGLENLAIGNRAVDSVTTTSQNTGIGHYALGLQTNGNYNTALGFQAGGFIKNGSNNTFLGYGADVSPITLTPSNSTALGSGAVVTQSNMVRVGNTSTTLIGGSVGFTTISDERVKTGIQENVPGLDFISRLRPVTYFYNTQMMDEIQGIPANRRNYDGEKEKIRYSGFLAQEVRSAALQSGYDFSGVSVPKNEHSLYGINYSEMVVPLVKAVQELKAIVEQQQKEMEELKARKN
ncbi:MAG: tail fiber domain-containing protein [Ferruginibacter sp.]